MVVSTETADEVTIAIAELGGGLRSSRARPAWIPDSVIGLVAAGLALLLPVLTLRTAFAPAWTPRYALLGLEAAIGLPLAIALLRTRLRATVLVALGFLTVATASTVASDNPAMSFFGMEFWGTGLLFVGALVGIWAIGTSAGARGARAIERAILVGLVVNCVVVVLEVFVDLSRFGVLTVSGQPAGLLGQPVALGAFLIAGLWLVGRRATSEDGWRWLAAIAGVGASIELAGERFPLLLLPVVLVALVRRCAWRRAVAIGAAALLGVGIGWSLIGISAATPSASQRLQGTTGDSPRIENYKTAFNAIADRPILGWGPGRYQAATSQYRTHALETAMPDGLYADAHNSVLQYGVTTGVLGLVFLGAWVALCFRRAAGPLAGFAALIMIVQLVQPQDVGLTPLAFLALGASMMVAAPRRVVPVTLHAAMVGAAVLFAGLILVGGYREWRAYEGSTSDGFAVAKMLPHWPDRAFLGEASAMSSSDVPASVRVGRAREWTDQAINRDRRDVRSYVHAALLDIVAVDTNAARQHLDDALRLSPWSPNALVDLAALEQQQGDKAAAIKTLQQVIEIEPNYDLAKRMLSALTNANTAASSPP